MAHIEPVTLGLLEQHATLPEKTTILERFAGHYRDVATREAHDAESVVPSMDGPVADLESLVGVAADAADEGLWAAVEPEPVAAPAEAVSVGAYDDSGLFNLGSAEPAADDPFAALDAVRGDDSDDGTEATAMISAMPDPSEDDGLFSGFDGGLAPIETVVALDAIEPVIALDPTATADDAASAAPEASEEVASEPEAGASEAEVVASEPEAEVVVVAEAVDEPPAESTVHVADEDEDEDATSMISAVTDTMLAAMEAAQAEAAAEAVEEKPVRRRSSRRSRKKRGAKS